MRALLAVSLVLLSGCSVLSTTPDIVERTKRVQCPVIAPARDCLEYPAKPASGDNLLVAIEEGAKAHDACSTRLQQWVRAWDRCAAGRGRSSVTDALAKATENSVFSRWGRRHGPQRRAHRGLAHHGF